MKKYRVYGAARMTVSTVIEAEDDENLTDDEILERAAEEFDGIGVFGDLDRIEASDGVKFGCFVEAD